jgi:hypothetical protein
MMDGETIGASPIIRAQETLPEERFHPSLSKPSSEDLDAISNLRAISVKALQISVDRGFPYMARLKDERAFIITDKSRRNYLARRLDGTSCGSTPEARRTRCREPKRDGLSASRKPNHFRQSHCARVDPIS